MGAPRFLKWFGSKHGTKAAKSHIITTPIQLRPKHSTTPEARYNVIRITKDQLTTLTRPRLNLCRSSNQCRSSNLCSSKVNMPRHSRCNTSSKVSSKVNQFTSHKVRCSKVRCSKGRCSKGRCSKGKCSKVKLTISS